jgi:hypothetical protein
MQCRAFDQQHQRRAIAITEINFDVIRICFYPLKWKPHCRAKRAATVQIVHVQYFAVRK